MGVAEGDAFFSKVSNFRFDALLAESENKTDTRVIFLTIYRFQLEIIIMIIRMLSRNHSIVHIDSKFH